MITIVIALKTEALALIKTFNLKKDDNRIFPIYSNQNIRLIISGVGIVNASIATTYVLTKYAHCKNSIVINIGICGSNHKNDALGTLFQIHKIIDTHTQKVFHIKNKMQLSNTTGIASFSLPQTKVNTKYHLVDMESAGFFLAAKKFFQNENIYLFKIVSDHINDSILTKEQIEHIVNLHITTYQKLIDVHITMDNQSLS